MKTFFDSIFSFVWDVSVDFYLWTHSSFSEKSLIIMAVIIALIGIYTCCKALENDANWFLGTLFAFIIFIVYGVSLYFMYSEGFVHWSNANGDLGWISMILFWVITLIMIYSGFSNNRLVYSIVSLLCLYVSCLLLGKHAIWAILPFAGIGGGSTFIGTFTDTNGNKYDVFRRD